jgi:hypothetical protein
MARHSLKREWIMRKAMMFATLLLGSSAGQFNPVQATEPVAQPLVSAAEAAPELKSEPMYRVDAEAFARRIVNEGRRFLRYDYAGDDLWVVVYAP